MYINLKCTTPAPNAEPPCPAWCVRPHAPGAPVAYHESAPLASWEKTPGDVRTVTAIQFVGATAKQTRAAEWVAVKGGERPLMFDLDQARTLSTILSPVPGCEGLYDRAAGLLAA